MQRPCIPDSTGPHAATTFRHSSGSSFVRDLPLDLEQPTTGVGSLDALASDPKYGYDVTEMNHTLAVWCFTAIASRKRRNAQTVCGKGLSVYSRYESNTHSESR